MPRHEFWDWPPPRSRRFNPVNAEEKIEEVTSPRRRRFIPVDAPPRRTSWFDTPIGARVARAIFRLGVGIWATAAIILLTAMMLGGMWLLIVLAKAI
jgi:hypothetical protein